MAVLKAPHPCLQSVFLSRFAVVGFILICVLLFEFSFVFRYNSKVGIAALVRTLLPDGGGGGGTVGGGEHLQRLLTGRPTDRGRWFEGKLPVCPIIPPSLEGPIKVDKHVYSYQEIEDMNVGVEAGGRNWPRNCSARHHVAIIIPFRDRPSHLKIFLTNIHHFLRRQQLDYGIYIVEPMSDVKFNRAMLLNIGFTESIKRHNYTCFVFHDVDLIPEDDRNIYSCPEMPRHISVAIDKYKYRLPYTQLFGGVSALTKSQFIQVNGFSNKYFGWGGEDDDMFWRIRSENFDIMRYSSEVARYKMLSHAKDVPNPDRLKLLKSSSSRYKSEGLNTLKYTVLRLELRKLYTWILVDINEKEIMEGPPRNDTSSS